MSVFSQKRNNKSGSASSASEHHGRNPFFGVQAKLSIGKPNDKYEKEADATADKVVAKSNKESNFFGGDNFFPPTTNKPIQKVSEEDIQKQEETEQVQEKPLAETLTPVVQLQTEEDIQEKCDDCEAKEEQSVQKMPFEDVQKVEEQEQIQEKCTSCGKEHDKVQRKEGSTFPALPEEVLDEKEKVTEEKTEELTQKEVKKAPKKEAKNTPLKGLLPPKRKEKEEIEMLPIQEKSMSNPKDNDISQSLNASKGRGNKMDSSTLQEMNTGFGTDFSTVNIHTNSSAVQMNKDLGAHAFTNGSDIYFNEGKYNPSSKSGKHLLAHELTHTIQQGASKKAIQTYAPTTEKKPAPQGNPAKPADGTEVEGKSNSKINSDDRIQDQDDLSQEEKQEKKDPSRGEVRTEQGQVQSEGISTPAVDRGAEAQEQISEQKAEMEAQLSEETPTTEESETAAAEIPDSNMAQADAASERATQAEQAATSVQIPEEAQPFRHPNVIAPVDSAGQALPRQAAIDTQVRGLGYIGEMLREKGYQLKLSAAEKEIHSYGLDSTTEKLREDLALAKEGTKKIDEQNLERKDISEKSKMALDESKQRQQFVAAEAPGLAQEADGGKSDAAALSSDASSKSNQSKSKIPDDPDARADAEQQSGEMEETAQGAQSMNDAITQTGDRARQYSLDAEVATQDNQQSEASIQETDNTIVQIDSRVAEMTAQNEESNVRIENAAAGPAIIRGHSQRTAKTGDELIAASIVMEQELNALQEEYLASMATIESKEDAEKRVREEAQQEQPDITPQEQQLYSLADMSDNEQEQEVSQMTEEEKTGLLAALDKMIATTPDKGTDATEGARTKVDLSGVNNAISGAQGTIVRAGLEGVAGGYGTMAADAMGVGQSPTDPRTPQIQEVDNQRASKISGVLDIADRNMSNLTVEQQQMLADRLVAESITDDIKNINVLQMGRDMLIGMVNPAMALQGVVGGFEKTFTGVANIFNADAWEKDPLGNLLQVAADISTGLAMIFSSILGIAGMITALMIALTIISWGTLSPITGPVIGWMGTVMTYAGWGAIVSGLLAVYFNSLAYIKNLHDAGTANTARELFGNTEQMKQNATDGFQGAMAIVEGVGAVKMGPSLSNGEFMGNIPRSPGAFARQTIDGARNGISAVASLPGRAARGARRLFAGGRQGLIAFKNKIQGFFNRSNRVDAPPSSRRMNGDMDASSRTRVANTNTSSTNKLNETDAPSNRRHSDADSPNRRRDTDNLEPGVRSGKDGELGSVNGKKVEAEMSTPDGHVTKVLEDGQCAICSYCKQTRDKFDTELRDANNTKLREDLDAVEARLDADPTNKKHIQEHERIREELLDRKTDRVMQEYENTVPSRERSFSRDDIKRRLRNGKEFDPQTRKFQDNIERKLETDARRLQGDIDAAEIELRKAQEAFDPLNDIRERVERRRDQHTRNGGRNSQFSEDLKRLSDDFNQKIESYRNGTPEQRKIAEALDEYKLDFPQGFLPNGRIKPIRIQGFLDDLSTDFGPIDKRRALRRKQSELARTNRTLEGTAVRETSYGDLKNLDRICFPAGTLIKTEKGALAIEKLKSGDIVYSFNQKLKQNELKKILKTFTTEPRHKIIVTTEYETIETTGAHPFWVENLEEWIQAKNLRIGMQLRKANNSLVKVKETKFEIDDQIYYNFSVQSNKNYFVGTSEILVHNSGGNGSSFTSTQKKPFAFYRLWDDLSKKYIYVGRTEIKNGSPQQAIERRLSDSGGHRRGADQPWKSILSERLPDGSYRVKTHLIGSGDMTTLEASITERYHYLKNGGSTLENIDPIINETSYNAHKHRFNAECLG